MKWTSKDSREFLDLDKVAYWKFRSKDEAVEYNKKSGFGVAKTSPGAFVPLMEEIDLLEVYIGGTGSLVFRGEVALEIYNMLISKKELI